MPRLLLLGTYDTKAAGLGYLADLLRAGGAQVTTVDLSTRTPATDADISAQLVASHHPDGAQAVLGHDERGPAVAAMGLALARFLPTIPADGVLGIGGGGGTSMIATGLRALPYGVPKLLVSTLASGDTAPFIGISDLILMPAVTDLAGLNTLTRRILHNAAQAVLGMAANPAPCVAGKPALGLTMFGVTTPCVTAIAAGLPDYDCMVFHATGTGGQTMEKLADGGLLTGLFDITTTEVADHLFGGVLPCTADRFGAAARTRIRQVVSLGALDMINFGAPETVPPQHRNRLFCQHNPQVTLMRTTPAENAAMGTWIADRLNRCDGPTHLMIPETGLSALDAPGKPFHDPTANDALFRSLEKTFLQTRNRRLTRLPLHINDPAFAAACLAAFLNL